MNNVSSFIDTVVTKADSKQGGRNGIIAGMVQRQDAEHVANRIALTFVALNNERRRRRIESVRQGVPIEIMSEKPEHMLSFVQSMMNNCCWAARAVVRSGQAEEQANGIDFSQSVAEQAGLLETACIHNCDDTLMDDWATLNELHTWLCTQMNYMTDLDPLFLYAEKAEVEPGVWEHVHQLMDFPYVLIALDDKVLELAEKKDDVLVDYANKHVFGSAYAA
jgi:hypothetical protein